MTPFSAPVRLVSGFKNSGRNSDRPSWLIRGILRHKETTDSWWNGWFQNVDVGLEVLFGFIFNDPASGEF
jgi:hypothetical protein